MALNTHVRKIINNCFTGKKNGQIVEKMYDADIFGKIKPVFIFIYMTLINYSGNASPTWKMQKTTFAYPIIFLAVYCE